ncbi:hypothetical protein JTB14_027390 [Gonioctena quinquepunctata]|nr:hypothetical protein JTB14_027390 [Gonioctena quinquepunctata]
MNIPSRKTRKTKTMIIPNTKNIPINRAGRKTNSTDIKSAGAVMEENEELHRKLNGEMGIIRNVFNKMETAFLAKSAENNNNRSSGKSGYTINISETWRER